MEFSLAQLLDPVTPSQFRDDYYTIKPLLVSNMRDKFDGLFGWESLNTILNSSQIPHPTMKLVLDGIRQTASNALDIIDTCRDGATLVLDRVDMYDPKVAALAACVSSELGEPTRINLYYSQPSRSGFERHYDTHDVFILQIAGCKSWEIFEPTVKFPLVGMDSHGLIPPEEPFTGFTLEPGDVLYIPRGYWHEATAQVRQSLHLTLGIYARTGIDFLSWLVNEFRGDVNWRQAFPLTSRDERVELQGPPEEVVTHFNLLRQLLISKIKGHGLIENYYQFCIASDEKSRPFDFPFQADPHEIALAEDDTYSRLSNQRVILEKDATSGVIRATVWGRVLTFSEEAEPAVRHIFTTPVFKASELMAASPRLTRKDINALLRTLLGEGIIVFGAGNS
jgi:ribosomal protein L16 Arg81 hydroxylase